MVPRVDGLPVGLRRRDREDDLDDSSVELAGDRESDVLENAEHAQVRGQNLRDEALDSRLGGQARKLLDETCADPVTLELVVDRKRCLGARAVAEARPGSERHDPFTRLARERAHERAPFIPVRVEERLHEPRAQRREPVEAEVAAFGTEPLDEREEPGGVVPRRRA